MFDKAKLTEMNFLFSSAAAQRAALTFLGAHRATFGAFAIRVGTHLLGMKPHSRQLPPNGHV